MKIMDVLRKRHSDGGTPAVDTGSPDAGQLPVPGYDQLDDKEVGARLREHSQVELAAIETYERSHKDRPEVLDKLRYMRRDEPLPGYDALSPEQITHALAGADAGTVKAVRDYERKFGHRRDVLDEAMRVLPTATEGAGDALAHEARDARVRKGLAGRDKTVRG